MYALILVLLLLGFPAQAGMNVVFERTDPPVSMVHLHKWRVVLERFRDQDSFLGREISESLPAIRKLPISQRIGAVQGLIQDNFTYADDQEVWGRTEFWATPLEFSRKGRGDCEDFAIAKFLTLRAVGISGEYLRLVIVKKWDINHVVVAVKLPGSPIWILDNQAAEVLSGDQTNQTPLFSLVEWGGWDHR